MTGEDLFWELAEPMFADPGVSRSTMMGMPCLRHEGRFLAMVEPRSQALLVKLPEQRVVDLIDAGHGEAFAPAGRTFREWVAVPVADPGRWQALLDEAKAFAGGVTMDLPQVVSREEWRAARRDLLAREKELTGVRAGVDAARRAMPMVKVDKEYVFEAEQGPAGLLDIFEGRRQLVVYHFMWRWDLDAGCPSCSLVVDNIGHLAHLHAAGTSLAVVSRGPWPDLSRFTRRMGWTVPFYSSYGSDFNYDFHVTLDGQVAPAEYNFEPVDAEGEMPGASVFLRAGERIFHTYSTYARGLESLLGTFTYLDLTPFGRQEDDGVMAWVRHHDSYHP